MYTTKTKKIDVSNCFVEVWIPNETKCAANSSGTDRAFCGDCITHLVISSGSLMGTITGQASVRGSNCGRFFPQGQLLSDELQKSFRCRSGNILISQPDLDDLRWLDQQMSHGWVIKVAVDPVAHGISKPCAYHGVGCLNIHGGELHIGFYTPMLKKADAVNVLSGAGLDVRLGQDFFQRYAFAV